VFLYQSNNLPVPLFLVVHPGVKHEGAAGFLARHCKWKRGMGQFLGSRHQYLETGFLVLSVNCVWPIHPFLPKLVGPGVTVPKDGLLPDKS